jgi:hypothetical protein
MRSVYREDVVAGDGAAQAVFRLVGPKGIADAKLTLTQDGKKLLDAEFCRSSEG